MILYYLKETFSSTLLIISSMRCCRILWKSACSHGVWWMFCLISPVASNWTWNYCSLEIWYVKWWIVYWLFGITAGWNNRKCALSLFSFSFHKLLYTKRMFIIYSDWKANCRQHWTVTMRSWHHCKITTAANVLNTSAEFGTFQKKQEINRNTKKSMIMDGVCSVYNRGLIYVSRRLLVC